MSMEVVLASLLQILNRYLRTGYDVAGTTWPKACSESYRGVFMTLANIYDGVFLRKYTFTLKTITASQ